MTPRTANRRRTAVALALALVAGLAGAAWTQRDGRDPGGSGAAVLGDAHGRAAQPEGQGRGGGPPSGPPSQPNPPGQGGGPSFGPPSQPNPPPGQPGGPPFDPDDAACDADGVHVGYTATVDPDGGPGFVVSETTVSGVALTCAGAVVRVVLLGEGAASVGSGAALVPQEGFEGTVVVPMTVLALARDVTRVAVEIEGGELPIPAECQGMGFDKVIFGTLGDDVITGTALRDLIFGLTGDDVVDGGPQADCIVGGSGNNTLRGGAGDDVILGGSGDDTIYSGPGRNHVDGGGGDNTCYVRNQTRYVNCRTVIVRQANQW